MKKEIFSKWMLALLTAVSCFAFTSCGDDDEPRVEDSFTTEYTFEADFSSDLLKTLNVKAYILSPDGSLAETAVTKANNTWTLKGESTPDKAGVLLEFSAKQGDFSGVYDLEYTINRTVKCLNNGVVSDFKTEGYTESFTIDAENLTYFYGTGLILAGEINSSGKASVTDGTDLDFGLNSTTIRPGGTRPWL